MDCIKTRELLSAYIDKELPEAQKHFVEAHLMDCADCSAALSRLQQTIDAVADAQRFKLPAAAADRLAAAIEARLTSDQAQTEELRTDPAKRLSWRQRLTGPAFISAAASAAMVAIAAVLWLGPMQTTKNSAPKDSATLQAPDSRKLPGASEGAKEVPQEGYEGAVSEKDMAIRKEIDLDLKKAIAGKPMLGYDSSHKDKESKKLPDGRGGRVAEAKEQAAKIAAGSAPTRILKASSASYKNQSAWYIVVERLDRRGHFIGAVVSKQDGRVLYLKIRTRP